MVPDEVWSEIAAARKATVTELHATMADLSAVNVWWYRDRDGDPIALGVWATLYEWPDYKFVDRTTLANGRWVATIWMGGPEGLGNTMPLFEGSVFPWEPTGERSLGAHLDQQEYESEAEAIAGHAAMVARWSQAM